MLSLIKWKINLITTLHSYNEFKLNSSIMCHCVFLCKSAAIIVLLDVLYPEAPCTAEIEKVVNCQNHPLFGFFSCAAEAHSTKIQKLERM